VDHPWHVYANPICPYICPILSLSRHIVCNPSILSGSGKLFEGEFQYERFNKIFKKIVIDHSIEFEALGLDIKQFGTHSIRKGLQHMWHPVSQYHHQ